MSVRRSSTAELRRAVVVAALCSCRGGDAEVVVTIADGAIVAPFASPEAYVPRLAALGAPRLLVPWTEPETDVGAIRDAIAGTDVELILGLTRARTYAEEHNTPGAALAGLDLAIERAKVAGPALAGIHLDHAGPGLPAPELGAHLDATLAVLRRELPVPVSYTIRARTIDVAQLQAGGFPAPPPGTTTAALDDQVSAIRWANAWADVLGPRVDRIIVSSNNAARGELGVIAADLDILIGRLRASGSDAEVWATVESASALSPSRDAPVPRLRPARPRVELEAEVDVLRSHVPVVLISGGEHFEPGGLLGPEVELRAQPAGEPDLDLERRAEETNARLRRCCLRDGQVVTVYDHRYERDHGDNLWQEDACWLTGLYTSALSFRAAVLGTPEAAEQARAAWGALHQMVNTTPLHGEVVRSFARTLYTQLRAPAEGSNTPLKRWHRAEDRELYWVGDISVDQLSGWFQGVAVYHDLVATAEERALIAADVSAVLDMFLANDLHAIEWTGARTRFGDLRAEPILALAFFQIGAHITGDARHRAEYERLLDEEGAHFAIGNILAVYRAAGRFGSDHFYSSGFYPLITYETEPGRRAELELAFEIFHELKRHDGDAYADTVYGVFHPDRDTGRRAYGELVRYRPEHTANAGLVASIESLHPGPFVPIEVRPASELDFDYVPPGAKGFRGGLEHRFSGVGFLVSYWMARHHGLR